VYTALCKCLSRPETNFRDVARVIGRDQAICASVLKLVNSAFFGSLKRVTNITEAVGFLGIARIREIVLTLGVIKMFEGARAVPGFSIGYLQRHGLLTALIARCIERGVREDDAAMSGMLHELGQMIFATRCPKEYSKVLAEARERPLHEVEREHLGATHAEVGAYLLGIWGLPTTVVEAIAHHHDPRRAVTSKVDTSLVLYVADHMASKLERPAARVRHAIHDELDEDHLRSVGLGERLEPWKSVVRQIADKLGLQYPSAEEDRQSPNWSAMEPLGTPEPQTVIPLDEPM
jgi:HD-like signal output (HDOD) protein